MTGRTERRFTVEHVSDFQYGETAQGSLVVLRLRPREDNGQALHAFALDIDPAAAPIAFADAFGNGCHLFNIHRAHQHTLVRSRSEVTTVDPAPLPERLEPDAWEALREAASPVDNWEFMGPSRFARPSPALAAFTDARAIRRGRDPLTSLLELAAALHGTFRYEPASTSVDSPIEDILETGRGVCQDYTHVMITIARSWGIPSRYVSGYLHLEGKPGEQTPAGTSHAWAEFMLPDLGWIGFDPTNDTLADHRHVRIAVGRDYADAAPTRGVVVGGGDSRLDVRVTVVEGGEPEPAYAPRPERSNLRDVTRAPLAQPAGANQ